MQLGHSLKRLEHFIRGARTSIKAGAESPKDFPNILFQRAELGGLGLWGDEAEEYVSCLKDIWSSFSHREDVTISAKQVEDAIQVAVLKALDVLDARPETDFEARLKDSLEELRVALQKDPISWRVHLSVRGFPPDGLPFQFGGAEFYLLDEARLEQLERPGDKVFGKLLKDTGYLKPAASLTVTAVDSEAARGLAKRFLQKVLDALNFYADLQWNRWSKVYMPGESCFEHSFSLEMPEGDVAKRTEQYSWQGPTPHFLYSDIGHGAHAEFGVDRISSILEKRSARTPLEERILSALQWAGRATVESKKEQAFLLFAIALEALMLGKDLDAELSYRLRVRAAHVLGRTTAARMEITKDLKELYRIRSKIVHSGETEVTDADLSLMRIYAKDCVLALLIDNRFRAITTVGELEQWFEAHLLGGEAVDKTTLE